MLEIDNTTTTRLLHKTSSMYYEDSCTQQEIANRLNISRPKVSLLLKQAREEGIVQISVASPRNSFDDLEKGLEKKYHLKEVLITEVNPQSSDESIKERLGIATANYLHRAVSSGDIIGITWGTTLQAMVDAVTPKSIDDVHIVQALGGVGPPEARSHAAEISRRLSRLLGAPLTLLPAPGIVDTIEAKEVLLAQRQIRKAVNLFSNINILIDGIGSMSTNPALTPQDGDISPALLQELINSEAVGDLAFHFFDIEGNEINSRLKELVIGISIEEIKQIDTVVGVAGGDKKTEAIQGVLNASLINLLITDNCTAEKLL
jgi:DNA-binding transcriptional regulator LsrR (DeoR family)